MEIRNKDQPMTCSRFPAGIVWPALILILIGCVLGTAGCVQDSYGAGDVTLNATPEPAVSLQGIVARPVTPLDTSMIRYTTIPVVRTTATFSRVGPTLNATGNEVNMSTVVLATETFSSADLRG
jgi:hypothetical protein